MKSGAGVMFCSCIPLALPLLFMVSTSTRVAFGSLSEHETLGANAHRNDVDDTIGLDEHTRKTVQILSDKLRLVRERTSLESWIKNEADQSVARNRRQASPTASQTISNLRKLLAPFYVSNVRQCTDLFVRILGECQAYVTKVLEEQFKAPLNLTLNAYGKLNTDLCGPASDSEKTAYKNCGLDCAVLAMTYPGLVIGTSTLVSTSGLLPSLASNLCTEGGGSSSLERAIQLLPTLSMTLTNLSRAVNITRLLSSASNPTCGGIVLQYNDPLSDLVTNLPLLLNTAGLFRALALYSESMQLVQFEMPKRVYAAYGYLAAADLTAPANATYINGTLSFMLCKNIFPQDSYLLCPWLCRNITEIFTLADKFQTNSSRSVAPSPVINLLGLLRDSCANESSDWTLCSDLACPPNSLCIPVVNGTYRSAESMSTPELATSAAQQQAAGFCFQSKCPFPLINTSNSRHWDDTVQTVLRSGYDATKALFKEVDLTFRGDLLPCGLRCNTFTFREEDEATGKIVIGVFAWLLFVVSLFALTSFYLNRERLNKYPTKILLYLNVTSFISNLATLIQFFTNKRSFVCFDDDTVRTNEPYSSSDPGSRACTVIFILLFYFLLVSLFWWLALAHAWYITFERLDTKGLLPSSNNRYLYMYHAVAWTVPAILTAVMLGKHYIDGFPLIGVCFTNNVDSMFALLSVPIVVVGLLGLPFLLKGSSKLLMHKRHMKSMRDVRRPSSRAMRSQEGLRNFLVKLMIIMIMSFINLLVQFAVGLFMRVSWKQWRREIEDHLTCMVSSCLPEDEALAVCPKLPDPNVAPFLLIPVTIIVEGLCLCFWAFTRDTWKSWKETTRKPSQFFSRATSLLTGNDKPTIANITAARKAARTLHMKAAAKRQGRVDPKVSTTSQGGRSFTSDSYADSSAWVTAVTETEDMSVTASSSVAHTGTNFISGATHEAPIPEVNSNDSLAISGSSSNGSHETNGKVPDSKKGQALFSPPDERHENNSTRMELEEMRCSPSSKKRDMGMDRRTSRGSVSSNGVARGKYAELEHSPGAGRRFGPLEPPSKPSPEISPPLSPAPHGFMPTDDNPSGSNRSLFKNKNTDV